MAEPDYVRPLLQQLLNGRAPELGARLKQRLNALLAEKGLPRFDEKQFGFRKFQSFLEQTQSDWLDVSKPEGAGDIHVSSKRAFAAPSDSTVTAAPGGTPQPLRSDIWQAFTNPDPQRKRYFQSSTGLVVHFLESEWADKREQIESATGGYLAITPIEGTLQQRWMREFLDSIPITGAERTPYEALLAEPYSSALNATFTRALGDHAAAWREFRTSRITSTIQSWARDAGIPLDQLRAQPKEVSAPSFVTGAPRLAPASSPRAKAVKLLELMSDDDIRQVIIPILLSTIMVRNR